jgi:hypothetical protein
MFVNQRALRLDILYSKRDILCLLRDIFYGIVDSSNLISILVWDFETEFLLNRHYNFYRIQTIKSQIIREMRSPSNLE